MDKYGNSVMMMNITFRIEVEFFNTSVYGYLYIFVIGEKDFKITRGAHR